MIMYKEMSKLILQNISIMNFHSIERCIIDILLCNYIEFCFALSYFLYIRTILLHPTPPSNFSFSFVLIVVSVYPDQLSRNLWQDKTECFFWEKTRIIFVVKIYFSALFVFDNLYFCHFIEAENEMLIN